MPEVIRRLSEALDAEVQSHGLTKLPPEIYREAAELNRGLRPLLKSGGTDLISALASKESLVIQRLTEALLRMRILKIGEMLPEEIDYSLLSPEEKYVAESLAETGRRQFRVLRAVAGGHVSLLDSIASRISSKYILVRFLEPCTEFAGTDLQRYGPYSPQDVAVLPLENARLLEKQGIVREIEAEL